MTERLSPSLRFLIAFLPRSKHLLTSRLQSLSTDNFGAQEKKICNCFHFFTKYFPWSDGIRCCDLSFFNVKPAFSFSSIIKRLFRFSSLSVMRVVSFKYLRFLIFLLAILIPACDSSSLEFHMAYSACKLNKQGDNIQHSHTPFPILNQSVVPRLGLTVISWPAHRFLVSQETGEVVWYSHLLKNLPVCCDPYSEKL